MARAFSLLLGGLLLVAIGITSIAGGWVALGWIGILGGAAIAAAGATVLDQELGLPGDD
jgi:hypothetical protein